MFFLLIRWYLNKICGIFYFGFKNIQISKNIFFEYFVICLSVMCFFLISQIEMKTNIRIILSWLGYNGTSLGEFSNFWLKNIQIPYHLLFVCCYLFVSYLQIAIPGWSKNDNSLCKSSAKVYIFVADNEMVIESIFYVLTSPLIALSLWWGRVIESATQPPLEAFEFISIVRERWMKTPWDRN